MEVLDFEARGDAKMVGIHGMGGIGKTTLAKAVYNHIFNHFDACSFISNVREAAKQTTGLVSLQEQLLREVFKDADVKVSSINQGIGIIKQQVRSKKVLLVLDDVDNESQLQALADSIEWFCSESRIIITTRDKRVLRAPRVKQNEAFKLKELDATQSLQLFSWHAFGTEQPIEDFAQPSKEVASTAAGLPLALVIFGSHFFDLKTVKEWTDMLEILKEDQHKDIHEKLKISYDALEEKEKKVFLDIACFFIRKNREIVKLATLMWEDCKFFPGITIKVLLHKSLISINDVTGEFEMHDHIWDMGRKIIQDEICSSRLWKNDETLDILENERGITNVEAIQLTGSAYGDLMSIEAKLFATMPRLRMLQLGKMVTLEGQYEFFPRALRWLQWQIPRPSKSLPNALCLENIVILDLSDSSITQVWNPQASAKIKVK